MPGLRQLFNFAGEEEEEEWVSVIRRQFEIDEVDNERCNEIIFVPHKAACEVIASPASTRELSIVQLC